MAKEKKKSKNNKYRLTIINDETLQVISTLKLTKYNVFKFTAIAVILISVIVGALLVYTPLNFLIPKRSNTALQEKIIANSLLIDSLEQKVAVDKQYVYKIKKLLQGKIPEDTFSEVKVLKTDGMNAKDLNFKTSELDSIVRAQIEKDENENLSKIENKNTATSLKNLHFVVPLKGLISGGFDLKKNHPAIDIVGNKGDAILATLAGTVVIATWSLETGYVIGIQHDNNLLTFYKHNSVLLKKRGDRVVAGESIAIIGNSGEETTGTHLHFELWYNGSAVNPKDYITF